MEPLRPLKGAMNLTLLLLIGAAGWIAWRMYGPTAGRDIRRRAGRIDRERAGRPAKADPRRVDVTALEKDPVTGVYKPTDRKP